MGAATVYATTKSGRGKKEGVSSTRLNRGILENNNSTLWLNASAPQVAGWVGCSCVTCKAQQVDTLDDEIAQDRFRRAMGMENRPSMQCSAFSVKEKPNTREGTSNNNQPKPAGKSQRADKTRASNHTAGARTSRFRRNTGEDGRGDALSPSHLTDINLRIPRGISDSLASSSRSPPDIELPSTTATPLPLSPAGQPIRPGNSSLLSLSSILLSSRPPGETAPMLDSCDHTASTWALCLRSLSLPAVVAEERQRWGQQRQRGRRAASRVGGIDGDDKKEG